LDVCLRQPISHARYVLINTCCAGAQRIDNNQPVEIPYFGPTHYEKDEYTMDPENGLFRPIYHNSIGVDEIAYCRRHGAFDLWRPSFRGIDAHVRASQLGLCNHWKVDDHFAATRCR